MDLKETKEYLKSIKNYILFSALLFIISTLSGYLFAQSYPQETQQIIEEFKEFFYVSEETTNWQIFLFILENNITKLLIMLILGIFAGLVPLLSIWANGMILGIFAQIISQELSWNFLILGILPHGIIEIPVLILSAAIGIKIGKNAVWRIFGRDKNFIKEFTKAIRFYIMILIPLIFTAALIESFITPLLLGMV